jgi:D-sedoheptulose 7-phosphate isomerase
MSNIKINDVVELITDADFIFICGNGGSASTAEHFTNDLFSKWRKAICLNSNTSIMTMIANDFGYENVLRRQLEIYARPKDLLIVFSCSGNSPNILKAMDYAKIIGCKTLAFLGEDGMAHDLATSVIKVNSKDFGIIESEHLKICHEIWNKL